MAPTNDEDVPYWTIKDLGINVLEDPSTWDTTKFPNLKLSTGDAI